MKSRSLPVRGLALLSAAALLFTATLQAQPTIYADAVGDVSTNVSSGGGTLDIVKMEVSDTETDVLFNMTVNGNIAGTDWGNFMIGIANMKAEGATNTNGNGWNRPIRLLAGDTNGMTHWVGSWVNGGGGRQLWTYGTTNWSGPAGITGYTFTTNTNGTSTISYVVSKANLGVTNGDTIYFDAYSSGGGGGDSAIDALSNPNVSVTGWGGPYTSSTNTGISSYLLNNSALVIPQDITFTVDMSYQISTGNFDPEVDFVTVAGSFNGDDYTENILAPIEPESPIYSGTFAVTAPASSIVDYRFAIFDIGLFEAFPENLTRTFQMPEEALNLPLAYFDNIQGVRDVEFSVDMNVQIELATFDPETQDVLVVGSFNDWDTGETNPPLADEDEDGIYTGTFTIAGLEGQSLFYKFYSAGMPNSGYESIDNRQATLELNEDGEPLPAQVLPVVFWNNQDVVPQSRDVTFSVDMSVQVELGTFTEGGVVKVTGSFNDWGTGGETYQLTDQGGNIYSGTFPIGGAEASTVQYKFFSPDVTTNSGYELLNGNPVENRTFVLGPADDPQDLGLVFWSNNDGGTTFAEWSGGEPATPDLVLKYAVGGAASPTGDSTASVTGINATTLSITAIVRIDDPDLTVVGETTDDLTVGPWTTVGVTVNGAGQGVDQTGVPEGCERKVFSVERDGDAKKFLRLKATLAGEIIEI